MATKEPTQKAKLVLTLYDTQEGLWDSMTAAYPEENSNVKINKSDGN